MNDGEPVKALRLFGVIERMKRDEDNFDTGRGADRHHETVGADASSTGTGERIDTFRQRLDRGTSTGWCWRYFSRRTNTMMPLSERSSFSPSPYG